MEGTTATVGIAFAGGRIATGTVNFPVDSAGLSASVDWGDGTATTSATVLPDLFLRDKGPAGYDHAYDVVGGHTYTSPGSYTAKVTVGGVPGLSATTTSVVTVFAAPASTIQLMPNLLSLSPNESDFQYVAKGRVTGSVAIDQLKAVIDWGDGKGLQPGTIYQLPDSSGSPLPGAFIVDGSHPYGTPGTYTVRVYVIAPDGTAATLDQRQDVVGFDVASGFLWFHARSAHEVDPGGLRGPAGGRLRPVAIHRDDRLGRRLGH